jgi:hypothetical protein
MKRTLIWIGVFAPVLHVVLGGATRTELMFNVIPTISMILILLSGEYKMAAMVYMLAALTSLNATLLPGYLWVGEAPAEMLCYLLAVGYGFAAHLKSISRLPSR